MLNLKRLKKYNKYNKRCKLRTVSAIAETVPFAFGVSLSSKVASRSNQSKENILYPQCQSSRFYQIWC